MLPFSFLRIDGMAPPEVKNNLVLVACQMLKRRIPNGGAEVESDDSFWVVYVKTDFKIFSIGPHLTGTLFNGQGGIKKMEEISYPLFRQNFCLTAGP